MEIQPKTTETPNDQPVKEFTLDPAQAKSAGLEAAQEGDVITIKATVAKDGQNVKLTKLDVQTEAKPDEEMSDELGQEDAATRMGVKQPKVKTVSPTEAGME